MYQIEICQPNNYPMAEIKILLGEDSRWPYAPYISAKKMGISSDGEAKVMPSTIWFSFSFDECTPNQAEQHAEWIGLAISAAHRLDTLIRTRADFNRPIVARIVGKAVVVYFREGKGK